MKSVTISRQLELSIGELFRVTEKISDVYSEETTLVFDINEGETIELREFNKEYSTVEVYSPFCGETWELDAKKFYYSTEEVYAN